VNRLVSAASIGLLSIVAYTAGCRADVITDWDAKATEAASPAALGEREAAIVNLAMFDAVNSIERRYQPYLLELPATEPVSAVAAAASAAATALALLHPQAASDFKTALAQYLSGVSAPAASIEAGARLGEHVAQKMVESRAKDGATGVDFYQPKTRPGQYVPTATMTCSTWPNMRPFVLASPSQFRPGAPPLLSSHEWATDYNEIKEFGSKNSSKRSAQQTETARFWLMTGPQAYHPLARQLVLARHLDLVDSARFMALFAATLTDAYVAAFDAKYHYEFWRPVTAIRYSGVHGNPATQPDATWQPLDATPMHPEYPCAHCIQSSAARVVLQSLDRGKPMPELTLTSSAAPGVTHRWSNLDDFVQEVANSRIWAGLHYRFSARVGTALGGQVGQYVVMNTMQPVSSTAAR
jgi:hypothetical protein